jgi:hypothetical protein
MVGEPHGIVSGKSLWKLGTFSLEYETKWDGFEGKSMVGISSG